MSNLKEECKMCSIHISLIFSGVYLFNGCFIVVRLMIAVMAISFELSINIYRSVWDSKMVCL